MSTELTVEEVALCIASLEYAAKELREGDAASKRLNLAMPSMVTELADEMDRLSTKLKQS